MNGRLSRSLGMTTERRASILKIWRKEVKPLVQEASDHPETFDEEALMLSCARSLIGSARKKPLRSDADKRKLLRSAGEKGRRNIFLFKLYGINYLQNIKHNR